MVHTQRDAPKYMTDLIKHFTRRLATAYRAASGRFKDKRTEYAARTLLRLHIEEGGRLLLTLEGAKEEHYTSYAAELTKARDVNRRGKRFLDIDSILSGLRADIRREGRASSVPRGGSRGSSERRENPDKQPPRGRRR